MESRYSIYRSKNLSLSGINQSLESKELYKQGIFSKSAFENIPLSFFEFSDMIFTVCKSLIASQLPIGKGIDILFFRDLFFA